MSRFKRTSHVIWDCQYHLVWVPKYRYRVLQGPIGREVFKCVMVFCQQLGCEVVELNVQVDHVHLLVKVAGLLFPQNVSMFSSYIARPNCVTLLPVLLAFVLRNTLALSL